MVDYNRQAGAKDLRQQIAGVIEHMCAVSMYAADCAAQEIIRMMMEHPDAPTAAQNSQFREPEEKNAHKVR